MTRYRVVYADGHKGEWRSWESLLYLIHSGRHWRPWGPPVMIPVCVEQMITEEQLTTDTWTIA